MATPTSIVLITTLLAVTAACARPVSSQSLRAGRGTVLPAGSAADIVRQCSRGTPGPVDGVWTPGFMRRRGNEVVPPALFPH